MKLPDRWKYIKLSDIGNISKGSGIKREDSNSGTIPAVRYGELYTSHNDYIKEFYSFISEKVAEESVLLKKGDLLFTCSGETKEDIGKCAAFVSDCKAYAGGDLIIFSPKVPCDSKFLGFLCNSYSINKQRYRYAQGDSVVHISTESIANLKITFPPLAEQQKIADILCEQDKIISLKQKLLEQKQQQKKWLMQKLLEVSYAGADVEEKFSLGGVVIDKRRWKKEILGNVTTYSCVRKKDLESSYICTENMKPDFGGISFYKTSEFIDGVCYEKGDILLGNIRPYLRKAWMADRDGVCSPDVLVLKMTDKVFSDFLYNVIANEKFLKYVMKGVKGTKMPRGDKEHVMKYVFYLPTLPEQKIIAKVLSAADKEIALLKSSIEQEKQKKKSLAQLLLTGTVRVKI